MAKRLQQNFSQKETFSWFWQKKRLHARKQGTTKGGENKDHQIDENERTMIKHNNNKHLHTLKTKSTYVLCSNQSHHHHHQEASHL